MSNNLNFLNLFSLCCSYAVLHFIITDKVVRKLFEEPEKKPEARRELALKTDEESVSKEISQKSVSVSKEVSEVLSVDNTSEIQEVTENDSVSTEIPSEKETPKSDDNSEIKTQNVDGVPSSDSDQKQLSSVSSLDENRHSADMVQSKSQTDTFLSESSSSKTLDVNSLQQSDDSIVSNRTVSSDDEQTAKVVPKDPEDVTNKLEVECPAIIRESSSSDSISEALSVVNSLSPEGEVSNESSSVNSKCNTAEGCEHSPEKQLTLFEHTNDMSLVSVDDAELQPPLTTQEIPSSDAGQKKLPSNTVVVNIVNCLSTSLIDDAFDNLYTISKECGLLKEFLSKSHVNKVPIASSSLKDKTTEKIIHSLLDTYLTDAFSTLYEILRNVGSKPKKLALPPGGSENSESNVCTSLANTLNHDTKGASEFLASNLQQDVNQNQIFVKSTSWSTDNFSTPEKEHQLQLEQQLILQQYPYFYRKIPNKPPPPYTPPSSTKLPAEFPFVKEKKPAQKITTVQKVTRNINIVVDQAVEVLLEGRRRGLLFSEISLPAENAVSKKLELTGPHQSAYMQLVFDLTKEIILEQYR